MAQVPMIILYLQRAHHRRTYSPFASSDKSVPTKCQYVDLVNRKCSGESESLL